MSESAPLLTGLDTDFLIHHLRHTSKATTEADKENSKSAKAIVRVLREQGVLLHLSCITVGEYLAGVEEKDRLNVVAELARDFVIVTYSLKSSIESARISHFTNGLANVPGDRKVLTADAKIVGCLKAQGIRRILTFDGKMTKLATKAGLIVNGVSATQNMFD